MDMNDDDMRRLLAVAEALDGVPPDHLRGRYQIDVDDPGTPLERAVADWVERPSKALRSERVR